MRFSKWHALGNSYLLIERAELGRTLDEALTRTLCDVGTGIGADGVLEVIASSPEVVVVEIRNPDGSRAAFSGNGTRIAAAWLCAREGVDRVTVAVDGRPYHAERRGGDLLAMVVGEVEVGETESLALDSERVELTAVSVGNPHAVVRTEPDRGELLRLGPLLENNGRFPDRTNVQLVRVDGPSELTVRVWERGVGETSASGSSAVAAAAAAVVNGWSVSPVTVTMPGGELAVELDEDLRATLVGPAVEICTGELRV